MARQTNRRRGGYAKLLAVLIGAGFGLLMLSALVGGLFSVRTVEVQGNRFCTREEVIAASGIRLGESIFSIQEETVRGRVNTNPYLEFVGLWKNYFPCGVIITVSEHTPRAKMMWMGMLVVVGDNGVVLRRSSEIDTYLPVPEIIGMKVQSDMVGQPITYSVAGQAEAIDHILDALDMQGVTGMVTEINIASPDNLTLLTEGGVQVILGNDERLPEKIALIRDTLPRVPGAGGVLNVSSGFSADYSPPVQ